MLGTGPLTNYGNTYFRNYARDYPVKFTIGKVQAHIYDLSGKRFSFKGTKSIQMLKNTSQLCMPMIKEQ